MTLVDEHTSPKYIAKILVEVRNRFMTLVALVMVGECFSIDTISMDQEFFSLCCVTSTIRFHSIRKSIPVIVFHAMCPAVVMALQNYTRQYCKNLRRNDKIRWYVELSILKDLYLNVIESAHRGCRA